jgi:lipid-A-disaccharide synthase
MAASAGDVPTIFVIAGEESGDLLGANLMRALIERLAGRVRFLGVGGARMEALGLRSMFPMEDVVLHGLSEAILHAPRLLSRIWQSADAIVKADPDVLVLIDCPGFNLRVGKIIGRRAPAIPIVDYVSPSVWAYLPRRARKMARYVDQLLAILPFEPEVHRRLGGPPTTYVGHPLIERLSKLRPAPGERTALESGSRPILVALPGSRRSEVGRLMDRFGETIALVTGLFGSIDVILPAVSHVAQEIRRRAADWPIKPTIVEGEAATYAAFRRAHVALAASGTVTLELALSGVPMVVAYRVDAFLRALKPFLQADSIVLPNLILGKNAIPEYLDADASPDQLAAALLPLLSDTPERAKQLAAFTRLESLMALDHGTPSSRAADIVLTSMRKRPGVLAGPV